MRDLERVSQYFVNEKNASNAIALIFFDPITLADWLPKQTDFIKSWVKSQGFQAKNKQLCQVPSEHGMVDCVLVGLNEQHCPYDAMFCVAKLPSGTYVFGNQDVKWQRQALFAWGKACYRFQAYKKSKQSMVKLVWPQDAKKERVLHMLLAIYWVRDMVNLPTESFSTDQIAKEIKALAKDFDCEINEVVGDELLKQNYPLVHAVGRAGPHAPRLLHLSWGQDDHPTLCLVGKGVCYDTGGLSLKPTRGMLTMKKDMGGAANAMALAYLVMHFKLPVKLHLVIPAVENSIAGNSYRPGDVFVARNGKSVEITNTDAEGRLILADALVAAAEQNPELIIDFATLTGAARVAVGPDISAAMAQPEDLAAKLAEKSFEHDKVTALPLYPPYKKYLKSNIADLVNASTAGFAGAIVAGLFLQEFVKDFEWLHLDIHNWNESEKPTGRAGGEAMGLFSVWHYLLARFSNSE